MPQCKNTAIYYVFATLAPQKHPKKSILATFGPTMSPTPQFGDKIGPNLGLYKQYLKPDDARKGHQEPPMSTKPSSKSRIMRAKAKKTLLCPESLLATVLKGLAAPGEALKNYLKLALCFLQASFRLPASFLEFPLQLLASCFKHASACFMLPPSCL